MNREITTKKVGRQKKLTNPCPVIKGEVQIMVGSPKCITYQWFERKLEKDGGRRKGVLGKDRTKVLINSIP